ncbi:hypothetical protein BASA81_010523 [Batrachochytrium salamandrivorans]|nr:hypothetical protein BASA81_010523 [Batrachochytrium salamandrivorans]
MQRGAQLIRTEMRFASNTPSTTLCTYAQSPLFDEKLDTVFIKRLEELHKDVDMKVAFLETESEALTHEIKATFRYFGEPEDSKLKADELVAVLAKFLKGFEIALSDIDRITEASAKQQLPTTSSPKLMAPRRVGSITLLGETAMGLLGALEAKSSTLASQRVLPTSIPESIARIH